MKKRTKDSVDGSIDDNNYPMSSNFSAQKIRWLQTDRPLCKHLRTFLYLAENDSGIKDQIKWAIYYQLKNDLDLD
jgi:hypothetical protein